MTERTLAPDAAAEPRCPECGTSRLTDFEAGVNDLAASVLLSEDAT
jgi:hypothetical protein